MRVRTASTVNDRTVPRHLGPPRAVTAVAVVAGLVIGLSACGGGTPDDPGATDGPAPPVPVRVVAGGDGGAAPEAASTRLAADSSFAADDVSILPWFGGFEYVVGPDLPTLPTDAIAHRFAPGADVDAAFVADLAEALGIEPSVAGDPVRGGGAVDGVLWRVGPDDGSAPGIVVLADPMVSWYYSGVWANDPVVVEPAPDEQWAEGSGVDGEPAPDGAATDRDPGADPVADPDVGVEPVVEPPAPPAGVPDAATAEARVRALLAELLGDTTGWEFETYADEWSASVTAWRPLGPARSPASWSFGFGGDAALQWAGGALATPEALGPYPLVDLDTALARLADQQAMWGAVPYARDLAVDSDLAVSEEQGVVDGAPAEDAGTPDERIDPPMPVDGPMPVDPPEPETAVLVDVRADLWWAWDADGTVWLLPAYAFVDTEGRVHVVPAVTDEYLVVDLPAPVDEPVDPPAPVEEPAEPAPVDPPTSEPVDPSTGEPASPGPDAPAPPFELDEAIGVELTELEDRAAAAGWSIRVVRVDGDWLAVTDDFVDTRINVEVDGGVVTAVQGIG